MSDHLFHLRRGHVGSARVLGALAGIAAAMAVSVAGERDASACGVCLHVPSPPGQVQTVITDEKMIYSISKDQTTLFDEIRYTGEPSSFAWVLPIKGTVTVGLSADVMFKTMETLTATTVNQPPTNCPPPPSCNQNNFPTAGFSGAAADAGASGPGSVQVLSQAQVGPYETVQLKSSDGSALTNWLLSHGYDVPAADAPVIAAYVADGFDFLALKLVPGKGVKAMQPVRVTSKGASISLPLHMVAVGTGPTTGITIWVVADGRWEPSNFPTFTITDSELVWDWTTDSSNYETLRLSKESTFGGKGWQIESSLEQSQYAFRNYITSAVQFGTAGPGNYTPPASAGASDGGTADAGPADPDASDGLVKVANDDIDILFAGIRGGNARITRMRSDVVHSALSNDMYLSASADQSEMTNQHTPKGELGEPQCPVYNSTCQQTGTVPRDQAVAIANGAGCNTTRLQTDWRTTLALLMAVVSFAFIRVRRHRRGKAA